VTKQITLPNCARKLRGWSWEADLSRITGCPPSVIVKLDRLSRNVHFISGLMERKVDFVACDMPSANAFMINIYAAVAQEERRMGGFRWSARIKTEPGSYPQLGMRAMR
jgi:hypothetical protein